MAIYGAIIRLEPGHGFGFIRDDHHGDWFFVASGVRRGGLDGLWVAERVAFSHEWTATGPRATDIHHEQSE